MTENQQKAIETQNRIVAELRAQGYTQQHAAQVALRDAPTPAQRRSKRGKGGKRATTT